MSLVPARISPLVPAASAAAFLALLCLVLGDWGPLHRADEALSAQFRAYGTASPRAVAAIRVVTDLMGTVAYLTVGLAATVLLAAGGRRRPAGLTAAVTAAVPVLWTVMHGVLHRPRPADGFVDIDSNGFPSGHTAHAAAAALLAGLLLWPRLGRPGRALLVALGALLAVGIGLTRVALLAHWPSDVLGGWLLSLAVVPALALAFRRGAPPRVSDPTPGPRSRPAPDCAGRASPGSGSRAS